MKTLDVAGVAKLLRPGMTVFIHGTATEPRVLVDYLFANPSHLTGVHLITSFVPGINTVNLAGLAPDSMVTNTMGQRAYAKARDAGQADWLRYAYSELPEYFRSLPSLDLAIVQCGQRDDGSISTGISGELVPLAVELAEQTCVILNDQMPIPESGCDLANEMVNYVSPVSAPLVEYRVSEKSDPASVAIAGHVAALVADGDTIQAGIGVVPNIVFNRLHSRRNLQIYAGMISDATVELAESGALNKAFTHTYGMAMGTQRLYRWLHNRRGFRVERVEVAHDRKTVTNFNDFVAMNSALEVALDGSVNAEQIGKHVVSGRGGLPDFSTAASAAPNGRSIIALRAANIERGFSRIVAKLANHQSPTLPTGRATHVITEYGVAQLKGASPLDIGTRLIAIAEPQFRDQLRHSLDLLIQ